MKSEFLKISNRFGAVLFPLLRLCCGHGADTLSVSSPVFTAGLSVNSVRAAHAVEEKLPAALPMESLNNFRKLPIGTVCFVLGSLLGAPIEYT
ncbi:hypothetical protein HMPREF1986_00340 [Oribacterium sp. oral taxon 078 str. F0263]|nr:hypothetical protein HMPREF1986_00340 [Oribacterium sp. oral taxon 078 str. F0263]